MDTSKDIVKQNRVKIRELNSICKTQIRFKKINNMKLRNIRDWMKSYKILKKKLINLKNLMKIILMIHV